MTSEDWQKEVGLGWGPLVNAAFIAAKAEGVVITGVKEKFGTLRIYHNGGGSHLHKLMLELEAKSAVTCEDCGDIGKMTNVMGWWRTVCSKHAGPKPVILHSRVKLNSGF